MAAISSVLLAEAASEEENAESILERHMSLVFSGPDTEDATPSFASAFNRHRGIPRVAVGGHRSTDSAPRHTKSPSMTQSYSAAEGSWSLLETNPLPFSTSASFGDGDPTLRSKLLSEPTPRPSHERTSSAHVRNAAAVGVSKHYQHQQRHLLSCQHTDAEKK